MNHAPAVRAALLLAAAVVCLATLGGCPKGGSAAGPQTDTRPNPEYVYTVRGEIQAVEDGSLKIHHEAIDDFVYPDGSRVGMNAMVMDFPLSPSLRAPAVTTGDKVAATFAVWTKPSLEWHVTDLEVLPADTELAFGQAKPMDYYRVHGVVRMKPDPTNPTSEFIVEHEPIEDFKDADGNVIGMEAMQMPFPIDTARVPLSGVVEGDRVAVEFVVRYVERGDTLRPDWWVVRVEKLPPTGDAAHEGGH